LEQKLSRKLKHKRREKYKFLVQVCQVRMQLKFAKLFIHFFTLARIANILRF
jgi:hypothetical protein